jgi:hypothetical protein
MPSSWMPAYCASSGRHRSSDLPLNVSREILSTRPTWKSSAPRVGLDSRAAPSGAEPPEQHAILLSLACPQEGAEDLSNARIAAF